MKKSNLQFLALAAFAAAFALPTAAKAVTYSDGDILLGFRATGGTGQTTNFVIDLGQASNFLSGGANANGSLISLGNYGTDLTNTYGAGWATRSDLNFAAVGAVGTGVGTPATFDINNSLYLSRNETTFGTQATAWPRATNNTQSGRVGNVTAIANGFNSVSASAASASNGVLENTSLNFAPGTDWEAKMPSFGGNYNSLEATFVNGAGSTALDLFQLNPGAGAGTYLGRLTFTNGGVVNFQSSAVPEPSTYALLALGGLALVGLRRMRRKVQA